MIVNYTQTWITNVVSLEQVAAYTKPAKSQTHTVKGEVRDYAGGRRRAVGSVGSAGLWPMTLLDLTWTQTQTLRSWMEGGVTVFVRDHLGKAMYATFFGVVENEVQASSVAYARYDVDVTFERVDVVEGV